MTYFKYIYRRKDKTIIFFFPTFQNHISRGMCCSNSCCSNSGKVSKEKKKWKFWVTPWLSRRNERVIYDNLIQELRLEEVDEYNFYFRMTTEKLDELLRFIKIDITKLQHFYEKQLPPKLNWLQLFIIHFLWYILTFFGFLLASTWFLRIVECYNWLVS